MEKIYESKKNAGLLIKADVETADKRTRTLFATELATNRCISMTTATLARWWTVVDTPIDEVKEEPKVEPVAVETKPVEEETVEVKPTVEKKPKKAKELKPKYDTLTFLEDILNKKGIEYKRNDKCKYIAFGGIQVYKRTRTPQVRFFVRHLDNLDSKLYTNKVTKGKVESVYVTLDNIEAVIDSLMAN